MFQPVLLMSSMRVTLTELRRKGIHSSSKQREGIHLFLISQHGPCPNQLSLDEETPEST